MNEEPVSRSRAILTGGIVAFLAFLCGLIIGLPVLGWWVWPVEWTDIPQTPQPTYTPFPTLTPYPSPTPAPEAFVMGSGLSLMEGPGSEFAVIGQVNPKEPLIVIGQQGNCAWLKVQSQSQQVGWLYDDGTSILMLRSCEGLAQGTYRPVTGGLKSPPYSGSGEFTIENQGLSDSVIILVNQANSNEVIFAAYVRQGESFVAGGIPDGTFMMYVASGSEWNGDTKRFTKNEVVQVSDETMAFTTTNSQYTTWKVTFNPILGGNTDLLEVPAEQLPEITN